MTTPPIKPKSAPSTAAVVAPKPSPPPAEPEAKPEAKPEPIGKLPDAFEPRALAALAKARDDLRAAEGDEERAAAALATAKDAHAVAVARLAHCRKVALEGAASLLGSDLADNFIAISDEESSKLDADAREAKRSREAHIRAKLLG